MKINIIVLLGLIGLSACVFTRTPESKPKENEEGWTLLFNGTDFTGWKSAKGGPVPAERWKIENGVLSTLPDKEGFVDIVTEESFGAFELVLEFKVTAGANSGVKYFILPGTTLGCEYQIIDNDFFGDEREENAKRLQGGLYDMIPPAVDASKPVGDRNVARIVSDGKKVEHWLNGEKTVSYDRSSDAFKEIVSKSKFAKTADFATPTQSPILLQDHGGVVSFMNIKIKKL